MSLLERKALTWTMGACLQEFSTKLNAVEEALGDVIMWAFFNVGLVLFYLYFWVDQWMEPLHVLLTG